MIDAKEIRKDFPILQQKRNDVPPVYFDSACMSLKPQPVIDALRGYYEQYGACAERSDHWFATETETKIEVAREDIAQFIGANTKQEIVFTHNTTHGINTIAHQFYLSDEKGVVIISDKEHNSNFLPWKELEQNDKITLEIIPTDENNQLELTPYLDALQKYENHPGTKIVSLVYTSNLDGVTFPLPELFEKAHALGFITHADTAQFIPHHAIDVKDLHADFITFSGHKMLGPTGTGVLWGKQELLEALPPFIVGGGTPFDATYDTVTYQEPPAKFEAGLQHYAGIIGFGAAVKHLTKIRDAHGIDAIARHETALNTYLTNYLLQLSDRISIVGPENPALRSGILSFIVKGIDHHQVSYILNDQANIMVRAGRHCVHGYCNARGIKGTVRVSLYVYNTQEDCDSFLETMEKVVKL